MSVNGDVERLIDVRWRWELQVAGTVRRNHGGCSFITTLSKLYIQPSCPNKFPFALQDYVRNNFYIAAFLHFNLCVCVYIYFMPIKLYIFCSLTP